MRLLIGSDDQLLAQRVQTLLVEQGLDCPAGHVVALDAIADRSGLARPDLIVFILPDDPRAGLPALRETRNTLPHVRMLAIGPATDPKLILETLKQGADEFLDWQNAEPELTGAVESISQAFTMQGGDVLYRVKVKVDEIDPRVLWGMTVEVTFEPME